MDRIDIAMLYVMSLLPKTFRRDYFRALEKINPRIKNIFLEKEDFLILEQQAEFGRLSEGILHDLMNPLSSISLHLEKLKSYDEDIDGTKNSIDKIVDISRKMNEFMGNVKSVMNKKDDLNKNFECNIKNSLITTADLYRYKMRPSDVKFVTRCKKNIKINIHPVRLNQLFMNLISNSIDAFDRRDEDRPRNKIRNTIRVTVEENRLGENIYIKFSDNGRGMNETQKRDAFVRPFTNKIGGSGIGLMTIRDIVENELKGKIRIDSKQDLGTDIIIEIPTKDQIQPTIK